MKTAKMMAIVAVLVFGMMFSLGGAAQAGTINIGDPLVPGALHVGDTFQLVFATSTMTNALSADIATYNTFVQGVAGGGGSLVAHLGVAWKAIGTTPTVTAPVNAPVSAPVYRVDGVKVADDYADLWDGTIDNPINKTESGGTPPRGWHPDISVWTGHRGTENLGTTWVGWGVWSATNSLWITDYRESGDRLAPMYALSEPITITEAPGRRA